MSIPCLPTETSFDVRCPVCDRGFLLLSEPTLLLQLAPLRIAARKALAEHHALAGGNMSMTVHPNEVFDLQGWEVEEPESTLYRWDFGSVMCGRFTA